MSTHKDCGEDIKWLPREDEPTRFMPPMEFAGHAYVLIDGVTREVPTYRPHRCDPEKVVAWQEYISNLAAVKGPDSYEAGISLYQAARERDREQTWELAMTVDCTVCDAEVDEKCFNMSQHLIKTGEIRETMNPHPARLELAQKLRKEAQKG